jgi:hypothetical protein
MGPFECLLGVATYYALKKVSWECTKARTWYEVRAHFASIYHSEQVANPRAAERPPHSCPKTVAIVLCALRLLLREESSVGLLTPFAYPTVKS